MSRPPKVSKQVAVLLIGFAASIAGCGNSDGPVRYRMAGNVSFDGKPVPFGVIIFDPADGNSGPQAAATIVNGKYDTTFEYGPVAGSQSVRIDGNDRMPTPTNPSAEALFPTFTKKVEISKSDSNLNFEITSSASTSSGKKASGKPPLPDRPEFRP